MLKVAFILRSRCHYSGGDYERPAISGVGYTECSVPLDLLNMARYYELGQSPVKSTCCLLLPSFCALRTVLLTTQFAEGHE